MTAPSHRRFGSCIECMNVPRSWPARRRRRQCSLPSPASAVAFRVRSSVFRQQRLGSGRLAQGGLAYRALSITGPAPTAAAREPLSLKKDWARGSLSWGRRFPALPPPVVSCPSAAHAVFLRPASGWRRGGVLKRENCTEHHALRSEVIWFCLQGPSALLVLLAPCLCWRST